MLACSLYLCASVITAIYLTGILITRSVTGSIRVSYVEDKLPWKWKETNEGYHIQFVKQAPITNNSILCYIVKKYHMTRVLFLTFLEYCSEPFVKTKQKYDEKHDKHE